MKDTNRLWWMKTSFLSFYMGLLLCLHLDPSAPEISPKPVDRRPRSVKTTEVTQRSKPVLTCLFFSFILGSIGGIHTGFWAFLIKIFLLYYVWPSCLNVRICTIALSLMIVNEECLGFEPLTRERITSDITNLNRWALVVCKLISREDLLKWTFQNEFNC